MRTRYGSIATALLLATIGGTASAAPGIMHHLFAFPGYGAQWQQGAGIPDDSRGQAQHGLFLEKDDPLATTPQGSGVFFTNVEGTSLTQLGYEVKNDGVCGVFPRFRVRVPNGDPETTSDDWNYLFECQDGTHTPSHDGWTNVSFSDADAMPDTLGAPPFTFGTQISTLGLLFHHDVGVGFTTLDNINVSGTIINKPGH